MIKNNSPSAADMPNLSVIICTHNPRPDYLGRVLRALQSQTLPTGEWELLLIDNASNEALADKWDLSWHPLARCVHEAELGLTPARVRGIRESRGQMLVFVDDDNVLAPNYLSSALALASQWELVGAFGGNIIPEFEVEPPAWAESHFSNLAIRHVKQPRWSNAPEAWTAQPCGAGLCIRAPIARHYVNLVQECGWRRHLDRRGASLMSAGDTDLILTSALFDKGWGCFPELSMVHLIPAFRLTEDYLVRLAEGINTSVLVHQYFANNLPIDCRLSFRDRLRPLYWWLRCDRREFRFRMARVKSRHLARTIVESMEDALREEQANLQPCCRNP